jgi:hypothetical protein
MTTIQELYSEIANEMELAIWEMPIVDASELNTMLSKKDGDCIAWFTAMSGTLSSTIAGGRTYDTPGDSVYFLARPASTDPDSIKATKQHLLALADEFRQRLQGSTAFTNVEANTVLSMNYVISYPVFNSRYMQCAVSFNAPFDLGYKVYCV